MSTDEDQTTTTTDVIADFDYGALPADDALALKLMAERVRERMRRTAKDIVEIGQELHEAKARVGHGRFGAWVAAEFEMNERTAQRFMNVAEQFAAKSDTVSLLTPKALYLLAAPGAADVREEVVEKVTSGEVKPSVKDVQAAIAQAKAEGKAEAEQALAAERAQLQAAVDAARQDANEVEARIREAVDAESRDSKDKAAMRIALLQCDADALAKQLERDQKKLRDTQKALADWEARAESRHDAEAIRAKFKENCGKLRSYLDGLRTLRPTFLDAQVFEFDERELLEHIVQEMGDLFVQWKQLLPHGGHIVEADSTLPASVGAVIDAETGATP